MPPIRAATFCPAASPLSEGAGILDTQLAYSIRFYCMGSVGMTREWVLNDNITSAETVVQMMFWSMPENLQKILF